MPAIVRITKVFESASTGLPVPSGSLNVYARGTTSPVTLYTDATGGTTSPNPTPIINGVVTPFVSEGSYDLVPVIGGNTYPAIPFEAVSGADAARAIEYLGSWNASTNTPSLVDGTGSIGDWYDVSIGGTRTFGGVSLTFAIGDTILYNGATWEKKGSGGGAVQSVAGKTGVVTLAEADIASLVGDLAATEKAVNKGAASGYASLDVGSRIPVGQLPSSVVTSSGQTTGQAPIWNGTAWAPGAPVPVVTKRVTLCLTGAGSSTFSNAPLDACNRVLVKLPASTTRWRLRFRNYNSYANTSAAGAIAIDGVWFGVPSFPASPQKWTGLFSAAPSLALGTQSIPDGTVDTVTPWVTAPGLQFQQGVMAGLSIGFHGTTSNPQSSVYSDIGLMYFQAAGAGASGGNAGVPLGTANYSAANGDWRLEYEFTTAAAGGLPVVAVIGDSIAAGSTSSATYGLQPCETWPALAGLRNGCAAVNMGIPSTVTADWTTSTDFKWTRCDLVTTIPDVAIVALGSNDVTNGLAASVIQANLQTVMGLLKTAGVNRIYLATVIPRNFAAGPEAVRVALNNYMRELPNGVEGVIDFDKALYVQAVPATVDADYMAAYPHPTRGGYARMAAQVTVPRGA